MVIVTNTVHVEKGFAEKLIERFNKVGMVEEMDGFLGLEVLLTENTADYEEVTISTRWNSKDAFHGWTSSEAFRKSHEHRGGQPEYIIKNKTTFYEVKVVREPIPSHQ
ncbi:heme oxygenase (staphylobilin-producing) [Evansella caseinilytica]|uniref:Heme oxygenase (Staphylobilin-producing) n=1 Tax=Evansella caseinilytica TaxID=1503961 RepID=A0A1H3RE14_9BACI|nr:heme oxygenase [Evansella caseinilytica]SDZ24062.1 heme oxygenase (staphylobilin-producing) [Evansella caseinilytica]